MSIPIRSLVVVTLIALAVVSHALARLQDSSRGGVSPETSRQGKASIQAEFPLVLVTDAMSLQSQGNETVVSIANDGTAPRTFRVEWLFDLGGADHVAGQSGPVTLGPGQNFDFTTANSGESIAPFFVHAPRDTNQDFAGRAVVFSDSQDYRGVGIEAYELFGIGNGFKVAQAMTRLNVCRRKIDGARQAGD